MTNVVKPKLTDIGKIFKIKTYNYNANTLKTVAPKMDNYKVTGPSLSNNIAYDKLDSSGLDKMTFEGPIITTLPEAHIFDDVSETTEKASNNIDAEFQKKINEKQYGSSETNTSPETQTPKNNVDSEDQKSPAVKNTDDINKKSVDELAQEVMDGKYGVGQERKDALGDRYDEVQKKINEKLYGPSQTNTSPETQIPKNNVDSEGQKSPAVKNTDDINKKSVDELAQEVMDGKYGVGQERKNALGDRYDEVQKKVNEKLYGPSETKASTKAASETPIPKETQKTVTETPAPKETKKTEPAKSEKKEEPKKEEKPKEEYKPSGNGKTIEIPNSIGQTGIIPNLTQYYGTRKWAYNQGKMADAYRAAGSQQDGNMATINGRYLVAVSPKFGTVGDNIDIQLANGKVIPAVIADVKGSDAQSNWGHVLGGGVDVVEWEINGTSQSQLSSNLKEKGWYGSKVTSITNTGSGHYY